MYPSICWSFIVPSDIKIDSNSKILRFNNSDDLNISCITNGAPKQELIWTYSIDNETSEIVKDVINLNTSKTRNELFLTIKNINITNGGTYTCGLKSMPSINDEIQIIVQSINIRLSLLNRKNSYFFHLSHTI